MQMQIAASLLAITLVTAGVSIHAEAQTTTEQIIQNSMENQRRIIEAHKQGIVKVQAQKDVKDTGTGIVLSVSPEKIWILTALHVVRDAKSIDVTFYSNQSQLVPAQKLAQHSDNLDLAVLEIRSSPTFRIPGNIEPYIFAANNTLQQGQHIWSVNGEWVPVSNTITRLSHDGDAQKFEYSNTSVGEGFSGGPIFDDYLDVIGMHDALNTEGAYAVGIKIDSALQTLQALGYDVPQAGPVMTPNSGSRSPSTNSAATKPVAAAASPCSSGCDVKLGALKVTQQYHSNMYRGVIGADCKEKVYQMPKGWPGASLYLHLKDCDYRGRHAYQIGFGPTDKPDDIDGSKGFLTFTGYSGQGLLMDGGNWQIHLRSETANQINAETTLSITPMGGAAPKP